MNKIKLPSMVEYVLQLKLDYGTVFSEMVFKFAIFLSQQPNISMFVPAVEENGKWRILSEPNFEDSKDSNLHSLKSREYQTALDNVIFEGFEVIKPSDKCYILINEESDCQFILNLDYTIKDRVYQAKTLEQLIPYNLTLTPKYAKELGL